MSSANEVQVEIYRTRAFDGDPTVNDDVTQGFAVGSRWTNVVSRRMFICVNADAGAAHWIVATVPSARFEYLNVGYSTNSPVYMDTGASFPYDGSVLEGFNSFKIVASLNSDDTNHTFDIRIIDETHDAIIVEAIGLSGSPSKQIYDLGPISNVLKAMAIFTVQVRRSGTASTDLVNLYTLQIEYT